jgi:hypothetical protein
VPGSDLASDLLCCPAWLEILFSSLFMRVSLGSEVRWRDFRPLAKKVGSSFVDDSVFDAEKNGDFVTHTDAAGAIFA